MGYSAVTLGDEDVEWFNDDDEIKDAIFDDSAFRTWTGDRALPVALEALTRLHRAVANQLVRRAVSLPTKGDNWAGRTIYLCTRLKRRRNELRRYYAIQNGWPALIALKRELESKYPRAAWGSLNGGIT